jgi:spermidine/putrescine transport system substrate-binding protein
MNRRAFLLSAGATACSSDRRPRLNVFNWSSYIAPETLTKFTQEHGIRVRYGLYESNEEMLAKVMTGNSGWDVVFPTHSRIAPMASNGLLVKLDHAKLRHLGNLAPRFQQPPWDPPLAHCVPYMWNATGICYNTALHPAPQAWSDLWNPALHARLTMLDDSEDVLGASLLKLGLPFDAADPAQLDQARREAVNQKSILRAYLNAEVRDQLVAGDVLAAQTWSTTAQQAMRDSPKLGFAFPREGFPVYADNAAILAESPRKEAAYLFLDYLLRPDIAAANARVAESATANAPALALLPDNIRKSAVLYPDDATLRRSLWPHALPRSAQRLRDRIWTEIKAS